MMYTPFYNYILFLHVFFIFGTIKSIVPFSPTDVSEAEPASTLTLRCLAAGKTSHCLPEGVSDVSITIISPQDLTPQ